jgi:hypothetical protein
LECGKGLAVEGTALKQCKDSASQISIWIGRLHEMVDVRIVLEDLKRWPTGSDRDACAW